MIYAKNCHGAVFDSNKYQCISRIGSEPKISVLVLTPLQAGYIFHLSLSLSLMDPHALADGPMESKSRWLVGLLVGWLVCPGENSKAALTTS